MISLLHACCSSILFGTARFVPKSSSRGYFSPWNSSIQYPGVRTVDLPLYLTKFHVQSYSTKKSGGVSSRKSKLVPTKPEPLNESPVRDEKEAFFVVRKGDVVGVYKSLSDCQAQVGTSICDPPASIYKGYSMPKDTEKYLLSCGLKNALYSIRAADITRDLFGTLVSCPSQKPSSRDETSREPMTEKEQETMSSGGYGQLCILEFDGASKGNPGRAGAGAILRSEDGSLICRLSEGLGVATNNVAEYRAVILGLRVALEKGFTRVRAQGDSKLVCMQIQGLWKVGSENIVVVYEEAKKLKDMFASFEISHVGRALNSDADAQANLAVDLGEGQVTVNIE